MQCLLNGIASVLLYFLRVANQIMNAYHINYGAISSYNLRCNLPKRRC